MRNREKYTRNRKNTEEWVFGKLGKEKVQKGESSQGSHPLERHSKMKTENLLTEFVPGKYLETSGRVLGRWNLR